MSRAGLRSGRACCNLFQQSVKSDEITGALHFSGRDNPAFRVGCVPFSAGRLRRGKAPFEDAASTQVFEAASDGEQGVGSRFRPAAPLPSHPEETHMIGLRPPAPGHGTDFAASPSTAQYRGAGGVKIDDAQPDAMNAVRPCAAGFGTGAWLARPNLRNCRPATDEGLQPRASDRRTGGDHSRPYASRALRNGIASGPKRDPPANAIPAP